MTCSSDSKRVKRHAVVINPALMYFFLFNLFIPFYSFLLISVSSKSLIADEKITTIDLIFDINDMRIASK